MHFELRNGSEGVVVFSRVTADYTLIPGKYSLVVRVFPAFASHTFSPIVSFDYVLGIELLGNLTCPPPIVGRRVGGHSIQVNVSFCPPGASVKYTFSK
jgi:hypothetical protein